MNLTLFRLLVCLQTVLGLQLLHEYEDSPVTNKVVYASFTSSLEEYLEQLEAQVATWASKPLAEGRYYCVGDREFVRSPAEDFRAVDCDNTAYDVSCKMGYLFAEAVRRDPDWLVVTQSDMYINKTKYEALLATYDHTQPVALGPSFGCGCTGIRSGCSEVYENGGYCGGGVYAISRTAVRKMLDEGEADFIKKMKSYAKSFTPEDMANSCAMRQAGVHMYRFKDDISRLFVSKQTEDLQSRVHEGIYSMHPVTPQILHWLQAIDDKNDTVKVQIEQELFKDGHCAECPGREVSMIQTPRTKVADVLDPEGLETHTCVAPS